MEFPEPKNMLERAYHADLHIHSVLSPCADREMIPHCIILEALEKQLDMIAVTDHNSCENVRTSISLGERFGVWVIPGMEIETREEIHFLTFFPTLDILESFYCFLQSHLHRVHIDESIWGEEWIVDEDGRIIEKKDYLLAYPLSFSVDELYRAVKNWRGIIIPSHVDHGAYSIIRVLGFIPPNLDFPVLEISPSISIKKAGMDFFLEKYRLACFSDAHTLSQIGSVHTDFIMEDRNWTEFEKAVYQKDGRDIFPVNGE